MAPVQSAVAAGNGTTSVSKAFTSSVTAGHLLTLLATNYTSGGASYISAVSGGGTWVQGPHEPYNSGGTGTVDVWYCLSATGGTTTVTVTIPGSPSSSTFEFQINEWSGSWTLDTTAGASNVAASTTLNAGPITPSASGNLLIAGATGNVLAGNNTNWTEVDSAFETAVGYSSYTYETAPAASAQTATWSQSTSTYSWAAISFKPATRTTTQSGVVRVQKSRTVTQPAVARTAINGSRTQSAVVRTVAHPVATQTGTVRTQTAPTKSQSGVVRVATARTTTQSGVSHVNVSRSATQPGVVRTVATWTKTQTATQRTVTARTKTQTGVLRVGIVTSNALSGRTRIIAGNTHTQPAVTHIVAGVSTINEILFVACTTTPEGAAEVILLDTSKVFAAPLTTGTPVWTVNDQGSIIALSTSAQSIVAGPVAVGVAIASCVVYVAGVPNYGNLTCTVTSTGGKLTATWSSGSLTLLSAIPI